MKLKQLQSLLRQKKLDAALFFTVEDVKDHNQFYFTQLDMMFGVLIAFAKGSAKLMVPAMEYPFVRDHSKLVKNIVILKKKKKLFEQLGSYLIKNKVRHIGINAAALPLSYYEALKKSTKAKFVDVGADCLGLRKIKTKEEIAIIKKAAKMTDEILSACFNNFHFKTEHEVKFFLEQEARKRGCELAFDTIVAHGKNSSYVHHKTGATKLGKGFLLIDYGIKYKGYCTDISRTIYLGYPSRAEVELYEKVRHAQELAIGEVRLGKTLGEIDATARTLLGDNFTHSLGHGFGLYVHEPPNVSPDSKDKVENNMVFTIEPGLYILGKYGVRIEDDILVENGKVTVLTKTSKDLIMIGNK